MDDREGEITCEDPSVILSDSSHAGDCCCVMFTQSSSCDVCEGDMKSRTLSLSAWVMKSPILPGVSGSESCISLRSCGWSVEIATGGSWSAGIAGPEEL